MADYVLDYSGQEIDAALAGSISHIAKRDNPHEVTKEQVGLGNVDNTSDANKPISTAAQAALDLKATIVALAEEAATRLANDNALGQRIDNITLGGRFLSGWNAATGLATTDPSTSPYSYRAGDFFIVTNVGNTNYKPSGSSYVIGQASQVVESSQLKIGYYYKYDGTSWNIIPINVISVVWGMIGGNITDQTDLANALAGKVSKTGNENITGEKHFTDIRIGAFADFIDDDGVGLDLFVARNRGVVVFQYEDEGESNPTFEEIQDVLADDNIPVIMRREEPYYPCWVMEDSVIHFARIDGEQHGFFDFLAVNTDDEWTFSIFTAYSKPASGIPESDLTSAAQTKLSNGNTALTNLGGKKLSVVSTMPATPDANTIYFVTE